jgi:hypothetical protein
MWGQNHKNNILKLFLLYAELSKIITINTNMCVKEAGTYSPVKTHCVVFVMKLLKLFPFITVHFFLSCTFSSVIRQMPGYNSQRRGTAGTSQFFFLCIIFLSLYYVYCLCVNV